MARMREAAAAIAVAGTGLALATALGAPSSPRLVTWAMHTMGTYAHVTVAASDSASSAPLAEAAEGDLRRVDSLMSNWTTTSEVARINREAWPGPTAVEPEVARVVDRAIAVWRQSDGAQDVTVEPLVRLWGFLGGTPHVPAAADVRAAFRHVGTRKLRWDAASRTLRFAERGVQIDLGGIAKGYAVDRAAERLIAGGVRNALVDLSGNMRAIGAPPGESRWRIGIRDPRDRMPYFARLELGDQGISTSGKYEQFVAADGKTYGHIIDPRTGRPADGLLSVTVVSRDAFTSDAWDTGLFVLGLEAARRKARARDDIDVVLVSPGRAGVDTVWVERTLRERFALLSSARASFHVAFF